MKMIKSLLKVAVPVILIFVLSNIDPLLGLLALLVMMGYFIYIRRGALAFYSASRKAAKKDFIAAEKILGKAYDKGWLSPYQEDAYGFLLLKRFGEAEKAEKIIKRVLNIPKLSDADKGFAELNIAMIHFYNGEIEKAVEISSELYKTYKTTNFYGSYGYFLIANGDLEKALEINLEAYDFNRSDMVIQDNLGQNYLLLGDYEKAEEIYEALIPQKPTFPEAYYNYALLKEKAGDIDEAIYQMKIAVQKEFNYLSTIDIDMVKTQTERLYDERDKIKEALKNE